MIIVVENYCDGKRGGGSYRYHRCRTKAEASDIEAALGQSDTTISTKRMKPLDALAFAIEASLSEAWPNLHIEGWNEDEARRIIVEELKRSGAVHFTAP